jgi:hypothetical protein
MNVSWFLGPAHDINRSRCSAGMCVLPMIFRKGMRDANFGHCLQGAIGFYLIALLRRIALASIASSTGLSSPLDDKTALHTSAVAACCSRVLFSSSQTPSSCFCRSENRRALHQLCGFAGSDLRVFSPRPVAAIS